MDDRQSITAHERTSHGSGTWVSYATQCMAVSSQQHITVVCSQWPVHTSRAVAGVQTVDSLTYTHTSITVEQIDTSITIQHVQALQFCRHTVVVTLTIQLLNYTGIHVSAPTVVHNI
jgi:hypothetical protein